jgi:radical SAM protein with 4Fe4S-binding SPASM domain
MDELASMGSLWLVITGGEPLLRQDFEEIYLHAKRKGFLITLFTNGTLLDKKIVDLLATYPPFVVEISLYGATKDTHNAVTGIKGSYEKCIEGIERIVNAKIKLKLKTMALTLNQHEIEAMDKIAQGFGCEFRFDPLIQKRIDNNKCSEPERYRILLEDVISLDMMFPKRIEAYRKLCENFTGTTRNNDLLYQCGAGKGNMHINPYGIAMGCMMMIGNGFSVREHSLRWIWEEGIASVINQKKDFSIPCDNCSLINLCGQCAAWSILEYGDTKRELTYLCEIAKKRGRELEFIS